jgi:hypothetical protein
MTAPAGWYPDPHGVASQRYFDGTAWTGHQTLTEQQRSAILQQELVARTGPGVRVVAQSPTSASVVSGSEANHVVHALLAIFSCGLWLPAWLLFAALQHERRSTVSVDEYGQVIWQ